MYLFRGRFKMSLSQDSSGCLVKSVCWMAKDDSRISQKEDR